MLSKKEAYEVGFDHGFTMAQESGVADAGCDGWDGMLINADPSFARENFGWDGCDSSDAAKELLAEYCRGAQDGANEAVKAEARTWTCSYNGQSVDVIAESEMEAKQKAVDQLSVGVRGFLDLDAINAE